MNNETDRFFPFYQTYLKELWSYVGTEAKEQEVRAWWRDLTNNPRVSMYKMYSKNSEPIGFLFVERLREEDEKTFGVKWYIDEAYIRPEYRNNGLMSALLDGVFEDNDTYGLHVIKNNTVADNFWKDYFHKKGYQWDYLPVVEGYEHCNFYKFFKK